MNALVGGSPLSGDTSRQLNLPMATKIKDGLFIGDAEASQDPEFIELNKITFVINCAGHQLPNLWEQHGLHYLTFPWTSDPDCALFDEGNVVIEQVREMSILLDFPREDRLVSWSYPQLQWLRVSCYVAACFASVCASVCAPPCFPRDSLDV